MVNRAQSSAAGVLALLTEPDPVFKQHALKALISMVPQSLYESSDLGKNVRDAAALLASKVYYYLGEYDEALSFALGAGTPKAIDKYIELRGQQEGQKEKIDPAIGIALEAQRLDVISKIYEQTLDTALLSYAMDAVSDTGFPYGSPHVHSLTRLLLTLSSPSHAISLLTSLVPDDKLLAYQFAFDLVEGGAQDFLENVRNDLPEGESVLNISLQDVLEARSSIYHTALTLQNAYMHAGTASDVFLRDNLDWLGHASNWAKFSATAGLWGESGVQGAAYQEGGALYALGLINAGCEVVQHGAALGLGVAGMGSRSLETFEDLKTVLFTDSAVAGEACGYSMGLTMLDHSRVGRWGAFIYYGRQEEADQTIKLLLEEKVHPFTFQKVTLLMWMQDPILRYGGVYTLALAYAGTSNNNAVRQLLHIAVSDTSDDVRRAANPSQVPRMVQLLSESYNPHVRCGATLALGIACAGTGLQDAVEILEPMTKDSVDFVRQGAFIALGMVLVQQSEVTSPSFASTRALYQKIVSDKHEDPVARFGAALGQGLIDAGGRNVTISLSSRAGSRNTSAIVGMVLFCQFWYWYPLAHCACLAFQPTGIIGLNGDLKAPQFEFISNARPSMFAYPVDTQPPKKEAVAKVATAVLSTTAKVKAREKRKANSEGDVIDTDEKSKAEGDVEMRDEGASGKHRDVSPIDGLSDEAKPSTSKRKEPSFEMLPNLSRVTPAQMAYISFPNDCRYRPVRLVSAKPKSGRSAIPSSLALQSEQSGGGGILILTDLRPDEEAEFIEFEPTAPEAEVAVPNGHADPLPSGPHIALDESAPEADPPEAFEVVLKLVDWTPLGDQVTIDVFTDTILDEDVLVERLKDYDIICTMRERTKFFAPLLDKLPKLKLLTTTGMKNNGIDAKYAKEKGIVVSGTVSDGNSTLEHIWALILSTVRYIPHDDANTKVGNALWQTKIPLGLAGRTIGLIGVGKLGAKTAAIAKAFGMKVLGWSPHLTPERAAEAGVDFAASKEDLIKQSDIVSIHIVLSESTRQLIKAADLVHMKPTAFFINTSRGPIVDEAALIQILENKAIAGAGLDVFDVEPLPLDHPLRKLENVVLTPHMGHADESSTVNLFVFPVTSCNLELGRIVSCDKLSVTERVMLISVTAFDLSRFEIRLEPRASLLFDPHSHFHHLSHISPDPK
ncbi:proteasome regulatory particle base [Salix suchowensis]|nr:proteasome regulatory particle base [Salix suchowensis]